MRSPSRSKVSYRAAISIFVAIALIVVLSGLFPTKPSSAAAPEATASVKQEAKRSFTLEEWQRLARSL